MAAVCASVLKSCLAKFTRLDSCGTPVVGPASVLVTKGYISVAATSQIEAGTETTLKNACGEVCISNRDCDQFKRYDLDMKFCLIDPELLELISNTRILQNAALSSAGFAAGETTQCDNFSLELWNPITPATCDPLNPLPLWYYFAFPQVSGGILGDITFEDGPLTLDVKGFTKGAGALWGRGPSCVLTAATPSLSTDHLVALITDVQPPAPVCGLQALAAADLVCV